MFFPKYEYSLTTKPLNELTTLKIESFSRMTKKSFKPLMARTLLQYYTLTPTAVSIQCEVEILPYRNICIYSVLRLSNTQHFKLELAFPGSILSFCSPEYRDAVDLSRESEQYML